MVYTGTNTTGWGDLINGNILKAVYNMYDAALYGWTVAILFFVFQSMLYMKTKNATLCWIMGLFFAALYGTSIYVKAVTVQFMFALLIIELGGILFMIFFK